MKRWLTAGVGLAVGAYASYVGVSWYHYGDSRRSHRPEERDELLDQFMPGYEVVERHRVRIAAPAAVTLAAARDMASAADARRTRADQRARADSWSDT